MAPLLVARQRLFQEWYNVGMSLSNVDALIHFARTLGPCDDDVVRKFAYRLHKRWTDAQRNINGFENKNKDWLSHSEDLSSKSIKARKTSSSGRPQKAYAESSDRSKRRKVSELRNNGTTEQLVKAAALNLRAEGSPAAAKLVQEISTNPSIAAEIQEAERNAHTTMSPEKALSLYVDTNSTKAQYQAHRNEAKAHNCNLYPPYNQLKTAMDECIPESVSVTEECAQVNLQSLVDHTTKRIMKAAKKRLVRRLGDGCHQLLLHSKWGFDGASGQSNYKQNFSESSSTVDDSSILITSLVPIQLVVENEPQKILWYNVKTSSPRMCRPIRIQFAKETTAKSLEEQKDIENQIKALVPTKVQLTDTLTVEVKYDLMCTMIDGKVCSALTGISTQRCPVCGAYPREFNNIEAVSQREPNEETYDFGLSPLHTAIRFMECLLHIAYRQDFKKTAATESKDKTLMEARKREVQEKMREKLGLLIDVPKRGSGTSNDGNTARKFFKDPKITAEILQLDEELVKSFSIIVKTLNCGYFVAAEDFKTVCADTYKLYVHLYEWYKMPPSVHRVLFHGADIITHCQKKGITISALSEEPQESRNKDIRKFREHYARKCSRVATMTDIFRRLLISSDPLVSSFRKSAPRRGKSKLPPEVLALLIDPAVESDDEDSDE